MKFKRVGSSSVEISILGQGGHAVHDPPHRLNHNNVLVMHLLPGNLIDQTGHLPLPFATDSAHQNTARRT
jgi:hypothetical protein